MSNISVSLISFKGLERSAPLAYVHHMPEEQKSERIQLLMTPSEVGAIDDWSFENRVRGRSEAIRRLVELGLDAAKTKPPTK